jgi:hypothetical protein
MHHSFSLKDTTMRTALVLALVTATTLSASRLEAQYERSRGGSIGFHVGADVSDQHTIKLVGGQFAINLASGIRVQLALSSVIEEPGTFLFAGTGLQWYLPRGRFRPFVGGGLGFEYGEVGPFSDTNWGWLAHGGFEVPTANVTPFVELRLLGFSSVATQVLGGLKIEVGR